MRPTSTRSSRSARSPARRGRRTRPAPRSSGSPSRSRSTAASPGRFQPARPPEPAERSPAGDDRSRLGGRCDRLLERQVLLELLAPDRRDPPRGHRRQSGYPGRSELEAALRPGDSDDAAARDAELPRPSVRAQLRQQCDPACVRGLLRHRPDGVRRRQLTLRGHTGADATLRPLLSRAPPRSSAPASGAASTSGGPTCRVRSSASGSPTGSARTSSSPPVRRSRLRRAPIGREQLADLGPRAADRDPLLRERVALADRDRVVLERLLVDRERVGRADLVLAPVAAPDLAAVVVLDRVTARSSS